MMLKHLKKESSPEEEQLLKEWLAENPENRTLFEKMQSLWMLTGDVPVDFDPDADAAWQKVKMKTGMANEPTNNKEAKVFRLSDYMPVIKIAASVFIVLTAIFMLRSFLTEEVKMVTLRTSNAKKSFILPDSSEVWLNKNSSLTFTEGFNDGKREVSLKGEGYFEIRKDAGRTFSVLGNASRIIVLGTSFNVKAVPEQIESVQVFTGKVKFGKKLDESDAVVLTPGYSAAIKGNKVNVTQFSGNKEGLSWKTEQLEFNNSTLEEVVAEIENYYEISILIQPISLKKCRFTGTFSKPDLKEMLQVIALSMDVKITEDKNGYLISGKGCP